MRNLIIDWLVNLQKPASWTVQLHLLFTLFSRSSPEVRR